jgi:4-diphosphocytidyl-2C-methyl-D-erythritol kinase
MTALLAFQYYGLTWAELLGILSSVVSGSGSILVAIYAVRKAKKETRAKVEHECLERITKIRAGEQQSSSVAQR